MRFLDALSLAVLSWQAAASPAVGLEKRQAAQRITISPAKTYQEIDGFGFSAAFQRANLIINLPAAKQKQVLDLLFNTQNGTGFSILRNGIGSTPNSNSDYMNTILPRSPGSPNGTPQYVWDGKDSGQLWLSQQAVSYGVSTIYANAWSAPGFMKNNNNDMNGGSLCGVTGVTCSSGDWKQAYANYLVQYIKFYAQENVTVTHLAFLNEPDLTTSYASMRSNGQQATDFFRVLNPILKEAGLGDVKIACCEGTGWNIGNQLIQEISRAGGDSLYHLATAHTYTSDFNGPLQTTKKFWQSEYSDLSASNPWTTSWTDGLKWAGILHRAMTVGKMNGYLWWEGVQWPNPNTNEKLILIDGQNFTVAKRLWAFAGYSRYIRPGAYRIDATGGNLQTSAYLNKDGTIVVVILNTGNNAANVQLAGIQATTAESYVTDNTRDMSSQATTVGSDGSVSGAVPARSLVTFKITV